MDIINEKKLYYHLRGKGVPRNIKDENGYQWQLNPKIFEKMNNGDTHKTMRAFMMKKINVNRNSKQQHFDPFSIIHIESEDTERILNKTLWNGRNFMKEEFKNYSLPYY